MENKEIKGVPECKHLAILLNEEGVRNDEVKDRIRKGFNTV